MRERSSVPTAIEPTPKRHTRLQCVSHGFTYWDLDTVSPIEDNLPCMTNSNPNRTAATSDYRCPDMAQSVRYSVTALLHDWDCR